MMEAIHKKALQKTRTRLVRDLDPCSELQDLLVSEHIFTPIMLEYIQAEKTRTDKARRLLDDLVRRGPKAYTTFLKCLRESGHGDLANAVEDKEYELRGLPVPFRPDHQEGQSAAMMSATTTVYTREHGPVTNPVHTEIQPPQSSFMQTQEYSAQQCQPSEESNPCGSMFTPSGASITQQVANPVHGISHVITGRETGGQRTEDVMEVTDGEVEQPPPQLPADPVLSGYQSVPVDRRYKMESNPRGLCFIINNKNYTQMSNRSGTDVNRDQLMDLFQHLNFGVDIRNDLSGMEMKRQLAELTQYDGLTRVDSLVICLLCHGDNENMYGTDGVAVNLLTDVFKIFGPQTCPALIGKPKLFVLNSCRGGHVSYRDTQDGSWFIQKLVEVFKEEAAINEIDIMMREVNRRVSMEYDPNSLEGQMPAPSNTLTRQWFFNPST
ncbi:caspase-3-like isoform X2 [Pecten maximus]|uniref:caspase-3-like isoform X2 n=1 Tax=Pecten maximus TaxID=6579 RepID=UPI0014588BAE|nr:caspase-3-like isoform X2 [Pecten maximus]